MLFVGQALAAESFDSRQQAFHDERRALYQERVAILDAYIHEGAEAQRAAVAEWRDENRERFEELRQMADALSRESEERAFSREAIAERIALLEESGISGDPQPAQREFIEKRRALYLERLKREKDMAELSLAERREALNEWRAEADEEYAELRMLAEAAGAESRARSVSVSAEPDLPEGISAEVRAFLEKRHELYRQRAELTDRYADASTEDFETALDQWREDRHEDFAELRSLAEAAAGN